MKETQSHAGIRGVTAVVAAYNPDDDFPTRISLLQSQVDTVVVVNDGSDSGHDGTFRAVSALGALVRSNSRNSGIATTLNEGIRWARQVGSPHFILTMDQDSELDTDYVIRAMATYDEACASGLNVGLVSAESFNGHPALKDGSVASRFVVPFDPWQSGMLIPRSTFDAGIFLNDEYFIDNVDSEFSLHIKQAGFVPILGYRCNLLHNLGEQRQGKFFGRKLDYTYHSPKRIYYITRNNLFLAQDYLLRFPKWFVRKTYHDILNQMVRLVLSTDKKSVAQMIALGARDGLLRRHGRFDDRYQR